MANHRISSTVHGGYHGGVKAKELRSQQQGHDNMRAGLREEAAKPGPRLYDSFDKGFKLVSDSSRSHQPRDRIGENSHGHGETDRYSGNRNPDRHEFKGHDSHYHDKATFSYGKPNNGVHDLREIFKSRTQSIQVTKITVKHSIIFSGSHLGSPAKSKEAHQNFLNAALSFIQKPNERNYKLLNDTMIKLMDPKFAPSVKGGAAQVDIRSVNGKTIAKVTMEVTPAPVKSLEEAREDLKKAYSSKRDGEKDIAGIRAEAYTNYIRALSEKFKNEGKISHTNNTPTTPVYKSSVIYVVKVTQINPKGMYELKKPDFKHNPHGRLDFKGQHSFWNDYRQNHKSYVDMLKHDSKKPHIDKDVKAGKWFDAKHDDRHTGKGKAHEANHSHHGKGRTDGAQEVNGYHRKAGADKAR